MRKVGDCVVLFHMDRFAKIWQCLKRARGDGSKPNCWVIIRDNDLCSCVSKHTVYVGRMHARLGCSDGINEEREWATKRNEASRGQGRKI